MTTRQQYAQHKQARRNCHHDSQEKPLIRFHSHTIRPCFFPRVYHCHCAHRRYDNRSNAASTDWLRPRKSETGTARLILAGVLGWLAASRLSLDLLDRSSWPSPQGCLALFALQPRAPGAGGQRPGGRAAPGCARHPHGQARLAVPAGQDCRPHHSATCSPEPPSSAGKSFSFGRPSRIGRTVSA